MVGSSCCATRLYGQRRGLGTDLASLLVNHIHATRKVESDEEDEVRENIIQVALLAHSQDLPPKVHANLNGE